MPNKKIAIITLVGDNYGNKYQNYAVEQIFSQYGDVVTYPLEELYHIDKEPSGGKRAKYRMSYIRKVVISRMMYKYDVHSVYRGILANLLYCIKNRAKILKLQQERRAKFLQFSNEYLHISETKLNRENTAGDWANLFDCFVCGSDQIWNPTCEVTSELAFCSFGPQKTICISPSFGVSEIPKKRAIEYAEWISPIYALSVREDAGARIIKDLTGREAEVLLDPTMLISIDNWHELCRQPRISLPEEYIVCYFLGKIDKKDKKKINKIAREKKLPVIFLFDTGHPKYFTLDPAETLFVIKNAKYVLTDSFHGTAFSILFKKDFCVFKRNEEGLSINSRLETLLKKFNFLGRVYEGEGVSTINMSEWDKVDAILNLEKQKANSYIKEAILSLNVLDIMM